MSLDGAMRDFIRAVVEELRPAVLEDLRRLLREERPGQVPPPNDPGTIEEVFVSAARAAQIAGVQPAAVRRWIACGELPCHHAGRLLRVRLDELKAFLARPTDKRTDAGAIDLDARARSILRGRRACGA